MQIPALRLGFSISATSRKPRGNEQDGREYYFISDEEFRRRVAEGDFVEYEEVYAWHPLRHAEIGSGARNGFWNESYRMDIDVKGGVNVKDIYGDRALSVFLSPPSLEVLERRLRGRATDSEDTIRKRLDKAEYEIGFASRFDLCVVNDDLEETVGKVASAISGFIAE